MAPSKGNSPAALVILGGVAVVVAAVLIPRFLRPTPGQPQATAVATAQPVSLPTEAYAANLPKAGQAPIPVNAEPAVPPPVRRRPVVPATSASPVEAPAAPKSVAPMRTPSPAAGETPTQPVAQGAIVQRQSVSEVIYTGADDGVTPPQAVKAALASPRLAVSNQLIRIELVIDGAGDVESARVVPDQAATLSDAMLSAFALQTIHAWKFIPAKKDGTPVKYRQQYWFKASGESTAAPQ